MKTTVEIADVLLQEAKTVASREKTSVRALLEEGLRWVLSSRKTRGTFRLRDASVDGKGMQSGVIEGAWDAIRDLTYDGRGS